MERENFYIILELPYDPPETDQKVIEAAISKKQTEWSRLRNHPTKGIQAQKYINMIPEIRRVMTDEALRAKEAKAAKELAKKDKESKYPEIDRHIDIYMGKGFITREEAIKLAEVHGLKESEIQDRINARKNEKYGRIDQQITLRMAKGYLTESEIDKIAKRNSVKPDEVRKRVRCPIRKDDKANDIPPPKQLDRSIEKAIRDNLKILNKSSLYDFLDLPESADMELLRDAATRKKKELSNISKKDAVVTASSILAGHCVTIFKSEESRNAYDISLAKSKLSELDSDIDIAGISGKIRPEYFDILVKKAMDFGMERDEAERYIKDYSKRKKWAVEMAPDKRRKYMITAAGGGALLIILIALGVTFYFMHQKQVREDNFNALIQQVDAKKTPEAKTRLLSDFIAKHRSDDNYTPYIESARQRIETIEETMAETAWQSLQAKAGKLEQQGELKAAITAYQNYLQGQPQADFARKAQAKISELEKEIEARDFNRLSQIMINGNAKEKIDAITGYLTNHPKGAHRDAVEKIRSEISSEYYIYVKNALDQCETDKNWQRCAKLCENYIALYDNSFSDQLRVRLEDYEAKIHQDKILQALKEKASGFGTDYQAAIAMYQDYLSAYPESPITPRVQAEIDALREKAKDRQIAESRKEFRRLLAQADQRFREKADGVVVDGRTGLMWQLLDTTLTLPDDCVTYERAQAYVKNLSSGGYNDWRLPTAEELAGIYKTPPYFPAMEQKWYWTSHSYSSYADGWHQIVDTITTKHSTDWEIVRRKSSECGAVRAVRGGK